MLRIQKRRTTALINWVTSMQTTW